MHLLGYLLEDHNPHKRLCILLCKNSLSGTTRSIRLSDYFPVLWIKASLNCLNPWFLSESSPWPTGKEKYTVLRRYQSLTNLIRHTKIFCLIAFLVFRRFSCGTTKMVYTEVPQDWGTPITSKSTNPVSLILFVGNPHYSILLHRIQYLKNLFVSRR